MTAHRCAVRFALALVSVVGTLLGLLAVVQPAVAAPGAQARSAVSRVAVAPASVTQRAAPSHAPVRQALSGPRPRVAGCDGAISLGATNRCDFPAAGTASYQVTVAGADRLRLRAAEPVFSSVPTVTLSAPDASVVCSVTDTHQYSCPVAAAGTYTVEVSLDQAGTVFTTVDSVVAPTTCAPSTDLSVAAAGVPIELTDPGSSYCSYLPDVAAGDVLQFGFDSNADDPLQVTVYNATGTERCHVEPLFTVQECTVGAGTGFRMFVNWTFDDPRSTVLQAVRLSEPTGCKAGTPDAYGAAPTRTATVAAFRTKCWTVPVVAAHPLAVQVVVNDNLHKLTWDLRTPNGAVVCSGSTGAAVVLCPAPSDGRYALFVHGGSGDPVSVTASLTSVLDSDGCAAVPSTAFGAAAVTGGLNAPAQVDCVGFSGTAGHHVQIPVWDDLHASDGVLLDPSGAQVCTIADRTICVLPVSGQYRVLVSSTSRSQTAYRVWATDLDATAGCTATTPDVFGAVPGRIGMLDQTTSTQCWSFTAPGSTRFLASVNVASGALFMQATVRLVGSQSESCRFNDTVPVSCNTAKAGTYVLFVNQYLPGYDPTQAGTLRVGLWRLDRNTGCATTGTSFAHAPVAESFAGPDAVECVLVPGQQAERLLVNAGGPDDLSLQHQVFDSRGVRVCLVTNPNDCRLPRTDTYQVLTYSLLHQVTEYGLSVASITRHAGCGNLPARPFGTAPSRTYDLDAGALFCAVVTRTVSYGNLTLRFHRDSIALPRFVVYETNGTRACAYSATQLVTCPVGGTGPFVIAVYGTGSVAGSVGAYDLAGGTGCASPGLGFDTGPTRGQLRVPGEVDCYAVAASSAVRILRLGVASAPEGMVLHETVLDPAGTRRCDVASTDYFRTSDCTLRASTDYRVLVWADEAAGTTTSGAYALHLWLITRPTGCTDLGSSAAGIGPVVGRLRDGNDERCYQFAGQAGSVLHFTVTSDGTDDAVPVVDVRRPDGRLVCQIFDSTGSCTLSSTTKYSMVVFGASSRPDVVRYRVVATTE